MKLKLLLATLAVLILIQFFPIKKENPPLNGELDFKNAYNFNESEFKSLKESCYDCHSHETTFPSYTRFQPLGWWIRGHIRGGRQKLNFSEWHNYDDKTKAHKLRECIEVIEEKRMPLKSYTWMHDGTALTPEKKQEMLALFKRLENES